MNMFCHCPLWGFLYNMQSFCFRIAGFQQVLNVHNFTIAAEYTTHRRIEGYSLLFSSSHARNLSAIAQNSPDYVTSVPFTTEKWMRWEKRLQPVRLFHSPREMCAHGPFSELAGGNCADLDAFYNPGKKKTAHHGNKRQGKKKRGFHLQIVWRPIMTN